jgi:hypothetical protein
VITSLTDIELGVRYDTVFDDAAGDHDNREGMKSACACLFLTGGICGATP